MSFTVNVDDLADALYYVERETGRDLVVSLNKAMLGTIIGSKTYGGAMHFTRKAKRSDIEAVPFRWLAASVRRSAPGRKLSSAEMRHAVARDRMRRIKAIGYHAFAGYNNAALALGGIGINAPNLSSYQNYEAGHGKGIRAISNFLRAYLSNTAPGIERIGGAQALQAGLDAATRDLLDYVSIKLAQRARAVAP